MEKLLVIVGPTGTGKTSLALQLAQKFNGELVSADSRQIYREMDIATGKLPVEGKSQKAKVKIEKAAGVWYFAGTPIYLYDVVNPDEKFTLADYQQLALEKIKEIHSLGKLPILVGGTGLYIQAVTEGLKIPKAPPDPKLREKLEHRGLDSLLEELKEVDSKTFEKIDKNNPRRVIRALEVYHQTGQPFSALREKFKVDFDILKIGLTGPREELYSKLDQRIDEWFEQGLIDEVKQLAEKYDENLPSLTSLGYRQLIMYLRHKITLEEAKQRMKFEHHGYVRRQMTWNKRDKSIYWFNFNDESLLTETTNLVKDWQAKEAD